MGKNSYVYKEAKYSGIRDLSNSSTNLRSSFTTNQKLGTDWLAKGNAIVLLKNSTNNRQLLDEEFKVGTEINLSPKINVHVNSPTGIEKRAYP